jgi:hypothetical protein
MPAVGVLPFRPALMHLPNRPSTSLHRRRAGHLPLTSIALARACSEHGLASRTRRTLVSAHLRHHPSSQSVIRPAPLTSIVHQSLHCHATPTHTSSRLSPFRLPSSHSVVPPTPHCDGFDSRLDMSGPRTRSRLVERDTLRRSTLPVHKPPSLPRAVALVRFFVQYLGVCVCMCCRCCCVAVFPLVVPLLSALLYAVPCSPSRSFHLFLPFPPHRTLYAPQPCLDDVFFTFIFPHYPPSAARRLPHSRPHPHT